MGWCKHDKVPCNSINKSTGCNFENRSGASYLDCPKYIQPKAGFEFTCNFCGSHDVDIDVYSNEEYHGYEMECNNCGNKK